MDSVVEAAGGEQFETGDQELQRYFAADLQPLDANPLAWWEQNEAIYSRLLEVAQAILCMPSTATSSE